MGKTRRLQLPCGFWRDMLYVRAVVGTAWGLMADCL